LERLLSSSECPVVFVIDACDKQRLPESKLELDLILSDELLKNRPVLILGNKVDLPGAASKQQLLNHLGLNHLVSGKVCSIEI
jgi:GTP-binding protein SAR1